MSNIQDQEQYIQSLEQIKQIEDKVQKEIDDRKEEVQNQIKALEADLGKFNCKRCKWRKVTS